MSNISLFWICWVGNSSFLIKGIFCFLTGAILVPVKIELVPRFGLPSTRSEVLQFPPLQNKPNFAKNSVLLYQLGSSCSVIFVCKSPNKEKPQGGGGPYDQLLSNTGTFTSFVAWARHCVKNIAKEIQKHHRDTPPKNGDIALWVATKFPCVFNRA